MSADDPASSPYVGPRPFSAAERALFFGRDQEIGELVSLVISHPYLLLYAVSGAGKTSLLTAGLLPALREQGFEVAPILRLQAPAPPPPGVRNAFTYAALSKLMSEHEDRELEPDATLAEALSTLPHEQDRYGFPSPRLVVFDQFEELFTLYQDRWQERADFVRQISGAYEQDPELRVLFSLREEYLAEFERFAPLLADGLRTRFHLERLRAQPALLAVKGPLGRSGVEFAPGVAESLVHDLQQTRIDRGGGQTATIAGEFVEPVHLQVVCRTLWGRLGTTVREVTSDDLEALGSVDDSLIEYYDQAVGAAAARARTDERRLRQEIERSFITSAGTRDTVFVGSEETAHLPAAALDELASQHLLRTEWRAGGRWLELAHDRLIGPIQLSNAGVVARHRRRRRVRLFGASVVAALALAVLGYWLLQPKTVVVPNVVGQRSTYAAETILADAGLTLSPTIKESTTRDVTPGTVVDQTPQEGEQADRGTAVSLLVAVAPDKVNVPQVVGLRLDAAEAALRSAGLTLGTSSPRRADRRALIDGQIPAAAEVVNTGTAVNVFVADPAKRAPAAPKPDLRVETAGIDTIGDDVVVTADVRNDSSGPSPATTVLATSPALGQVTKPIPSLRKHDKTRVEIHMPITAEARGTTVVVTVVVDPRNQIAERDNSNNRDTTQPWLVR